VPIDFDDCVAIRAPIKRPHPASNALSDFANLPDTAITAFFESSSKTVLVECTDACSIKHWMPEFEQLAGLDKERVGALILFCRADGQYDGYLRYFSPWYGKNEDIATGSAMRLLFPLLNDQLPHGDADKNGDWLRIRQLSERGGVLKVRQYNEQEVIVTGHVSLLS
jgi:predicted PhzF superfamily epimerase YddE/YHI9